MQFLFGDQDRDHNWSPAGFVQAEWKVRGSTKIVCLGSHPSVRFTALISGLLFRL